ncbi:hypothetical protein [Candidatus Nitronereus thalassa]|uniref:Secreted protein n=1 Tax=Candidatus Nitronereus thalassa TaxID=3020898 RepID=A0ABU3KB41_9BACT|nr:hypothetical protein [Candidatus Nitronereus thalassa]MDT7043612.1 hypothetical protein [Candidatus Nitronereus thalassa]
MVKKFHSIPCMVSFFGVLAFASTVFAQTTVTGFAPNPTPNPPTPGVWFESDVRIGGTASIADLTGLGGDLETNQPLPNGAAKLTTDSTNPAKAEVAVANSFGTASSIIPTIGIGYSWHKASNAGQNLNAAPSIKLTFFNPVCDETIGGDCFATLVYEPYQNGFGNNPAQDVWMRSDLNQIVGGWWTTGGFGAPNGAGGCGAPVCPTLADWLTTLTPDFGQADLVAVSVGVGSFNQGQIGYFDKVDITGTNADASYDFEPAPQFKNLGQCISTLIADNCAGLKGKARATCNHEQQMTCFDLFGVK